MNNFTLPVHLLQPFFRANAIQCLYRYFIHALAIAGTDIEFVFIHATLSLVHRLTKKDD